MHRGGSRTRVAELPGSRAACRNLGAEAGSALTICVGRELRCSNMTGSGGGRRSEGGRDSGTVGAGVSSCAQLCGPVEPRVAMAAAPEADVSHKPGRPEAPPRALARRPALSELAVGRRPLRKGRDAGGGGRAEASRAREGFAVSAVGCRGRSRSPKLSLAVPSRLNGGLRAPRLHGDGHFSARTPAVGLSRRRLLCATVLRTERLTGGGLWDCAAAAELAGRRARSGVQGTRAARRRAGPRGLRRGR